MGGPGSGAKPKAYPPELVEKVRRLYDAGHTQDEIAVAVNSTQKVLWNLMRRHNIKARVAAKRNQDGPANSVWKGDDAGYQAMHLRVETRRGKPAECSACDSTENQRYEWANLSGRYNEVTDYVRMCVSCHRQLDAARRRRGGDA